MAPLHSRQGRSPCDEIILVHFSNYAPTPGEFTVNCFDKSAFNAAKEYVVETIEILLNIDVLTDRERMSAQPAIRKVSAAQSVRAIQSAISRDLNPVLNRLDLSNYEIVCALITVEGGPPTDPDYPWEPFPLWM